MGVGNCAAVKTTGPAKTASPLCYALCTHTSMKQSLFQKACNPMNKKKKKERKHIAFFLKATYKNMNAQNIPTDGFW